MHTLVNFAWKPSKWPPGLKFKCAYIGYAMSTWNWSLRRFGTGSWGEICLILLETMSMFSKSFTQLIAAWTSKPGCAWALAGTRSIFFSFGGSVLQLTTVTQFLWPSDTFTLNAVYSSSFFLFRLLYSLLSVSDRREFEVCVPIRLDGISRRQNLRLL